MIFAALEDETGYVNLIVWNDLAERQRKERIGSRLLEVAGEVQREGAVVHILERRLEDLPRCREGSPRRATSFTEPIDAHAVFVALARKNNRWIHRQRLV